MFEPLTQVVFLEPVLNSHHLVLNVSKIETTRNICIYTELRQKICLDQPELINPVSRGSVGFDTDVKIQDLLGKKQGEGHGSFVDQHLVWHVKDAGGSEAEQPALPGLSRRLLPCPSGALPLPWCPPPSVPAPHLSFFFFSTLALFRSS